MGIVNKIIGKAVALGEKLSGGVSQAEALEALGEVTVTEGMPEILRRAAAEGAVLLKNNRVLPFNSENTLSVFSRLQFDWFFTGYGSGGDVNEPYKVNLLDGMKNAGIKIDEQTEKIYSDWIKKNHADDGVWGLWPRCRDEMKIDEKTVAAASKRSSCAVVAIGRSAGEDLSLIHI